MFACPCHKTVTVHWLRPYTKTIKITKWKAKNRQLWLLQNGARLIYLPWIGRTTGLLWPRLCSDLTKQVPPELATPVSYFISPVNDNWQIEVQSNTLYYQALTQQQNVNQLRKNKQMTVWNIKRRTPPLHQVKLDNRVSKLTYTSFLGASAASCYSRFEQLQNFQPSRIGEIRGTDTAGLEQHILFYDFYI